MDRKIKVVQYGAGKMSRYLMRYVLEHGGELVGAFCRNKTHIGKDVSEIIGNGYPFVGVTVENSADADKRIGAGGYLHHLRKARRQRHHHLRGSPLSVELLPRSHCKAR